MTEHTFHLAAAMIDKGRVVLVGDGAHTMRPTFGQGTALALTDVVMLAGQGPERYAALRRRGTAALYWSWRWGSLVMMPITCPAAILRDTALRLASDRLFSTLAGSAGLWKPPAATTII